MWRICKTFRFEAGHRVWKQNLSLGRGSELSKGEDLKNKCINLHGHSYLLEVYISASSLTEQDMVMDFFHLKGALKGLIEKMDHSFIIDKNDPMFEEFKALAQRWGGLKVFEVDFCPTAEELARFFYNFLKERLRGIEGVKVERVVLWETPTSKAEYSEE